MLLPVPVVSDPDGFGVQARMLNFLHNGKEPFGTRYSYDL